MSKTIENLIGVSPYGLMGNANKFRDGETKMVNPELIVGLELEIENFPVPYDEASIRGFQFTTDGSLRNNGIEAITEPVRTRYVENLLRNFYTKYKITEEDNYSERCSLHVHVNVCDMTLDQLASVALLYQVFERNLFQYIGQERGNNIFCVPWCQANVSVNLVQMIRESNWANLRRWQKYTALNLLPIQTRGSVEFRHMHGTCDVRRILEWLNIIGSMFKYAKENPVDELTKVICDLNTSSAYDTFLNSVFGEYASPLTSQEDFRLVMESGVIDAKFMLTAPEGLLKKGSKSRHDPPQLDGRQPHPAWAENIWNEVVGAQVGAQAVNNLRHLDAPPGQRPARLLGTGQQALRMAAQAEAMRQAQLVTEQEANRADSLLQNLLNQRNT